LIRNVSQGIADHCEEILTSRVAISFSRRNPLSGVMNYNTISNKGNRVKCKVAPAFN